ncbi:hypothetical protein WN51_05460 [Melipona quadrifasciata]|uniref:Uncharacterized protein n=1 Tax=Melipona quadrifasciata TaxID=166423 RepID=A0A0M9AAK3_9HYME|nr:hypothetical protein WN51_05460 [Melipona quadrifasciata]
MPFTANRPNEATNDEFAKTFAPTNRVEAVLNLRESRRAPCAMEHNSEAKVIAQPYDPTVVEQSLELGGQLATCGDFDLPILIESTTTRGNLQTIQSILKKINMLDCTALHNRRVENKQMKIESKNGGKWNNGLVCNKYECENVHEHRYLTNKRYLAILTILNFEDDEKYKELTFNPNISLAGWIYTPLNIRHLTMNQRWEETFGPPCRRTNKRKTRQQAENLVTGTKFLTKFHQLYLDRIA